MLPLREPSESERKSSEDNDSKAGDALRNEASRPVVRLNGELKSVRGGGRGDGLEDTACVGNGDGHGHVNTGEGSHVNAGVPRLASLVVVPLFLATLEELLAFVEVREVDRSLWSFTRV
jgi:hypothetical protein